MECVGMVGMGWNGLEWPLESGGMNLESVGMEFQHSGQSPSESARSHGGG